MSLYIFDHSFTQNPRKLRGVSDVIATILLIMVTVLLVAFVNNFLTDLAHKASDNADTAMQNNEKLNQKIAIPTAFCCGYEVCFEVKALGTNKFSLPTERTDYYLNDNAEQVYPWGSGEIGPNCVRHPLLEPGQGCFGKLEGPPGWTYITSASSLGLAGP